MKRLHLVLIAWAALGCSDRHVDDEDEVDAERLCRDACDLVERCWQGAPEFVTSCPGYGVYPTCIDTCLTSGGPVKDSDLGKDWHGPCRELRAEYYECVGALTCEDWYDYAVCSDTPFDARPCWEEEDKEGSCIGRH